MNLPPFPVDGSSLDLLYASCTIEEGVERSSLLDTLDMFSRLGGSDPEAIEEVIADDIVVARDPAYLPHDVILALIEEIRRLRGIA